MAPCMMRAGFRLTLLPEFLSIGFCVGLVAGAMAGTTAADQGPLVDASPPVVAPSVRVSVSTLDLTRLVPAHFGDWDAASPTPER